MAQVFSPAATLAIKLALAGAVAVAAVAMLALRWSWADAVARDEPPVQPIPFSHKHHVGDDGLDCRYCHVSVENAAFAGVPPTRVCMTCHSQLFNDAPMLEPLRRSLATGERLHWVRVHKLPDFVYFDHGIHVRKGVGCIECHGRVDEMPLMKRVASLDMQWCLACHRDPGPHLRPPERVFDMTPTPQRTAAENEALVRSHGLLDERRRTDCSTCHR
jgi:hypothetical protein